MQLFSPKKIDIAIVGAGPQALTLVTHLLQKKLLGNGLVLIAALRMIEMVTQQSILERKESDKYKRMEQPFLLVETL